MTSATATPAINNMPVLQRPNAAQPAENKSRNSRGGRYHNNTRGRGRGRGNRGISTHGPSSDQHPTQQPYRPSQPAPPQSPLDDIGGGGVHGPGPTIDVVPREGNERVMESRKEREEDFEAEVCFICASPVEYNSIAPCNHRTCHICALRLRALYKTRACAHCRTEAKFLIFTKDAGNRYEDFKDTDFEQTDETLGIKYTQREIYSDTLILLRYNCPDKDCDVACWGWPDLHRHVKNVHHQMLCDLCTRNKKVFTHEHELFTGQELRKHEKFGDDHPGAVDQSGFKGHPECGFCRQRFYGDDELYTHCRDKHERCHICDRRSQGRQQQYFVDYDSLEQHFRSDHFLCADQECLEKKFVVFESEMDLKAHQLEAHPNGLTKDARRDARRVDISSFDYRVPHQDNHRRGRGEREARGRGRGRDLNTAPLPHSTAQPMRRDELAYQRQMAIHNAQSASVRTFGGQLTSTDANATRPGARSQEATNAPRSQNSSNSAPPSVDSLNLDPTSVSPNSRTSPTPTPSLTPHQQARQLQHSAVIDRASVLLHHDPTRLSSFRDSVSSYRTSRTTAAQLIDTFFSLFDVPSPELGKLIKELAEIYENETKRNGILKAWNDWRAVNEDYPSLPGPSGVLPGSSAAAAGSGGHRVLKLKSSTAQSSRSAVSKQRSWGNAAGTSNPFPAISNTGSIARVGSATPWVSSAPSSSRQSPAPSRPVSSAPNRSKANGVGNDAFPALPAAAKPNTMIFGLTRGSVRWDDERNSNVTNPWGTKSRSTNSSSNAPTVDGVTGTEEQDAGGGGAGVGGKKGKKQQGKKQMLFKIG